MKYVFLTDPSFWILVSFFLLFIALSSRALKGLSQQLKTRQETIAQQITEVSALYEEAKLLLSEEKNHLKSKETEASQLKVKILHEIDMKKNALHQSIRNLHQKHEADLFHKMEQMKEKYSENLIKKIIENSCSAAEKDLKKALDKENGTLFLQTQISKLRKRK